MVQSRLALALGGTVDSGALVERAKRVLEVSLEVELFPAPTSGHAIETAPPRSRASLRLFFVNRDLSVVKTFLQRQLAKLMAGRLPIRDLMFAKETRLGTYSSAAGVVRPPAAIVAEQMMARDPRAEPKFGERVPYVVVQSHPFCTVS